MRTVPFTLACALAACSTTSRSTDMDQPDGAAIVRRLYDDHLTPGRLDDLGALISPDYAGPGGLRGPAAFAAPVAALRAALPDLRYHLEDVVASGSRVAVRWTLQGTHRGPFRGLAPTGQPITNTGMAIFELDADGRVVRSTIETDRLGFLQQLGAIPRDPAFGPVRAAGAEKSPPTAD